MDFSINKIVTLVVVIFAGLFLILGLIGEEGWLSSIKEVVLDVDTGIGQEEILAEEVSIPAEIKKEIDIMNAAINVMLREESVDECFYYTGGFSPFNDDVEILMTEVGENVFVKIMGGKGAKQIYDEYTIKDMGLCVIGGESSSSLNSENFFKIFLGQSSLGNIEGAYYTDVSEITISFDRDGFNENRIYFGGDDFEDFEGDEWLFTPDNKNICFFPTNDGGAVCQGYRQFLDDDCFEDKSASLFTISHISGNDEETIPYRSQNGLVNHCGQKDSEGSE